MSSDRDVDMVVEVETILADIVPELARVKEEARQRVLGLTNSNVSDARRDDFLFGLKLTALDMWQEVIGLADAKRRAAEAKTRADDIIRDAQATAHRIVLDAQTTARHAVRNANQEVIGQLERDRVALDAERESLRMPYADSIQMLKDILVQAGYGPEERYDGRQVQQPVPSPVLCWACGLVAAKTGTNPVCIQNGANKLESKANPNK